MRLSRSVRGVFSIVREACPCSARWVMSRAVSSRFGSASLSVVTCAGYHTIIELALWGPPALTRMARASLQILPLAQFFTAICESHRTTSHSWSVRASAMATSSAISECFVHKLHAILFLESVSVTIRQRIYDLVIFGCVDEACFPLPAERKEQSLRSCLCSASVVIGVHVYNIKNTIAQVGSI